MTITRDQIVATARTYLDVPFAHQGRSREYGLDCIGLVIAVAHDLHITDYDYVAYSRLPNQEILRAQLGQHMELKSIQDMEPGDVLLMSFVRFPQHVAILTGPSTIIHTYSHRSINRVVEHDLDSVWRSRIRGVYQFKGLA